MEQVRLFIFDSIRSTFFNPFFVFQERSFQKQPTIFLNKKQGAAKASKTGRAERYTRNVGLGFKTPREVR